MITGKLDTGLITDGPKKLKELKFTDYSINKFQSDFSKGRKTIRTNIPNSGIKGLNINQSITTRKRYFVQQFWFDKRSDFWTIGEFRLGIFGTKECQTKAVEIMKTHTDDNGMWIKSPKITIKDRRERIKKAELQKRQMLTIRQCIEKLCEANLPKAKTDDPGAVEIGSIELGPGDHNYERQPISKVREAILRLEIENLKKNKN